MKSMDNFHQKYESPERKPFMLPQIDVLELPVRTGTQRKTKLSMMFALYVLWQYKR